MSLNPPRNGVPGLRAARHMQNRVTPGEDSPCPSRCVESVVRGEEHDEDQINSRVNSRGFYRRQTQPTQRWETYQRTRVETAQGLEQTCKKGSRTIHLGELRSRPGKDKGDTGRGQASRHILQLQWPVTSPWARERELHGQGLPQASASSRRERSVRREVLVIQIRENNPPNSKETE